MKKIEILTNQSIIHSLIQNPLFIIYQYSLPSSSYYLFIKIFIDSLYNSSFSCFYLDSYFTYRLIFESVINYFLHLRLCFLILPYTYFTILFIVL